MKNIFNHTVYYNEKPNHTEVQQETQTPKEKNDQAKEIADKLKEQGSDSIKETVANTESLHNSVKKLIQLQTKQDIQNLQQEIGVSVGGIVGGNTLRTYFNKNTNNSKEQTEAIKQFQKEIGTASDGMIGKNIYKASVEYFNKKIATNAEEKTEEKKTEEKAKKNDQNKSNVQA